MFLQSAFLIGLAAVLVPILVHLLSRHQIIRVELGTTRFLSEVLSDTSRRRRIRRWLLLLTRVAIVGLLALMFARPSLPRYEDLLGGTRHIVLIDQSASMQAPGQNGRVLDDALAAARAEVEQLGKSKPVIWAAFDSQVEPLHAQLGDAPRIGPKSAADTNFAAALTWARDRIATEKFVSARVLLITDLQMTGLAGERELGTDLLPNNSPLRIIDVGRRELQNVGIQAIENRTPNSTDDSELSIAASIFNFGGMPMEDLPAAAIATNGAQTLRLKKTIDVAPSQASEALFDFGKVQPGIWQVTVDLDVGDDLSFDNRRFFALEVNRPDPVLVLDDGRADQPQASRSYYLTLALNAAVRPETSTETSTGQESLDTKTDGSGDRPTLVNRRGQFAAEQWFWADQGEPKLQVGTTAMVVVSDASELSATMVSRLEKYVEAGGRLLVFAGNSAHSDPLANWHESSLMPGKMMQTENAATMPFRITDIEASSSMLTPFLDPQHGDLSRLAFTSLLRVDIAQKDRVLARFDGQKPAITQHAVGVGRVAWFMASADDGSGTWTTNPLYLPLVRQMAADLLGRTGEGPIRFRNVGDPLPVQTGPKAEPDAGTAVRKRDATKAEDSASTKSIYFDKPGFVRLQPDQPLYVVNPAAKESDPTRVEPAELARQLGVKLINDEQTDDQLQLTASFYELWPYLAAALVTLLVLEFALANRTSA